MIANLPVSILLLLSLLGSISPVHANGPAQNEVWRHATEAGLALPETTLAQSSIYDLKDSWHKRNNDESSPPAPAPKTGDAKSAPSSPGGGGSNTGGKKSDSNSQGGGGSKAGDTKADSSSPSAQEGGDSQASTQIVLPPINKRNCITISVAADCPALKELIKCRACRCCGNKLESAEPQSGSGGQAFTPNAALAGAIALPLAYGLLSAV